MDQFQNTEDDIEEKRTPSKLILIWLLIMNIVENFEHFCCLAKYKLRIPGVLAWLRVLSAKKKKSFEMQEGGKKEAGFDIP